MGAIIELVKVNAFLIYESTLTVKFKATWKIQHYYIQLLNIKPEYIHVRTKL